jgi:hypothetical protein
VRFKNIKALFNAKTQVQKDHEVLQKHVFHIIKFYRKYAIDGVETLTWYGDLCSFNRKIGRYQVEVKKNIGHCEFCDE